MARNITQVATLMLAAGMSLGSAAMAWPLSPCSVRLPDMSGLSLNTARAGCNKRSALRRMLWTHQPSGAMPLDYFTLRRMFLTEVNDQPSRYLK